MADFWQNDPVVGQARTGAQSNGQFWANDEVVSAAPAQPDRVGQGMSGLNEGLAMAAGLPVDLANYALGGLATVANSATGSNFQAPESPVGGYDFFSGLMQQAGAIQEPTGDTGDRMLRRVMQEVGATIVPMAGSANRVARGAVALADGAKSAGRELTAALATGGGAALTTEALGDNPFVDLAGQILGGGSLMAGSAGLRRVITPSPASATQNEAARVMRDAGVDLTAGQATNNRGMRYMESELGGAAAEELTGRQAEQFTEAALAQIGVRAKRATPEVMREANQRIGAEFDNLTRQISIVPDRQFGQDLADVINHYESITPASQRAPFVEDFVRDVVEGARNGTLTGEQYQRWRSRLSRMSRTVDIEKRDAVVGFINALDDAAERSVSNLPQSQRYLPTSDGSTPGADVLELLQQARNDYRSFLAIEKAVSRAGEQAVSGIVTPANLRSSVATIWGPRGYTQGQGGLNRLARAGVQTMTPLPNSGTAQRNAAQNLGANALSLAGGVGGSTMGPLGAMAGFIAGRALPNAVGRTMLSGPGRNYLSNQILPQSSVTMRDLLVTAGRGPAISMVGQQTQGNSLARIPPLVRMNALN